MRERTPFPSELLRSLPNLRLLLSTGGRNLSLDLTAAKELNIIVAGTTGKGRSNRVTEGEKTDHKNGADSTTQHCIALILALVRNIAQDDKNVKEGGWQTTTATGLAGKTLGIVGLGRLGVNVARILYLAFNMRIICWSEHLTQDAADEKAKAAGLPVEDSEGKVFRVVGKKECFEEADVVSLHYVLSDRSRGIVGEKELAWMRPSAYLVNTSRGPLIDDKALLPALKKGAIKGAALDVFEIEPLPLDSELRSTKWGEDRSSRLLLSPHMGYVEDGVMSKWYDENVENIERWVAGKEVLNRIA
jgi:lactate dehydrogenase-like 2-hydroxyacid dehydrogenase